MLDTLTRNFDNHIALRLVQKWDFNDDNLCQETGITAKGISTLWKSVDKTVEFFETKKGEKTTHETYNKSNRDQKVEFERRGGPANYQRHDYPREFSYDQDNYNFEYEREERRYRLPPPPDYNY